MTTGTKQPTPPLIPRAALQSPLTPCTTTGTEQPVLHSSPPLTPCTTTGTEQPVLCSSPPLTPCTTTGTEQPVLRSIPPSLPVRLQAQSSPIVLRSLYVYSLRNCKHEFLIFRPNSMFPSNMGLGRNIKISCFQFLRLYA